MLTKDSFPLTHLSDDTKYWKIQKTIYIQGFPSKQIEQKKINNWKKYFMILNPNPNSGIQTMEFQIFRCIKSPRQGILKSMDFKSWHFK